MIRRLSLAMILFCLCLFAAPPVASSYDPFGGIDCTDPTNAKSTVCQTHSTTDSSTNPVTTDLTDITNIVAFAGGAAAVIVIIVSALRFITSGSDISTGSRTDTDVENARRSLGGALIGLAVIVLGRTLILFVLGKL